MSSRLKSNAGFTMVELIVAVAILGVVSTLIFSSFVTSSRVNGKANLTLSSTELAQDVLENFQSKTYSSIAGSYTENGDIVLLTASNFSISKESNVFDKTSISADSVTDIDSFVEKVKGYYADHSTVNQQVVCVKKDSLSTFYVAFLNVNYNGKTFDVVVEVKPQAQYASTTYKVYDINLQVYNVTNAGGHFGEKMTAQMSGSITD